MSDAIVTAIIAASVSFLVALVGALVTALQLRNARRHQEREISQSLSDRLYERRIALYPVGYKILSRIRKIPAPHHLPHPDYLKEIRDTLNEWAADASLFFSRDALKAYWELRKALAKNPAHGQDYSAEQAEKVWNARNAFRRALRHDIGNLYHADPKKTDEEFWEYM